jgi:pimeloyl-ACP methyl ester carboxylesterase
MDTSTPLLMSDRELSDLRSAALLVHCRSAGPPPRRDGLVFVWGHGWGHDHTAFNGLIDGLPAASHLALDFPGFGRSPVPGSAWGTATYADVAAEIVKPLHSEGARIVWVGHSFGSRVGLQLAARHPELVDRLCLIAGAGLQRRRSPTEAMRVALRRLAFRSMRLLLTALGRDTEPLRMKFGSADYRNAGPLRPILVKVVNEDLSEVARQVRCPTLLVYGQNDTETPPEIGERLAALIPRAELSVLPHQDHYSLLGDGRHLVLKRLLDFVQRP